MLSTDDLPRVQSVVDLTTTTTTLLHPESKIQYDILPLEIRVDEGEESLFADARALLRHVFPSWFSSFPTPSSGSSTPTTNVTLTQFKNGITNTLLKATLSPSGSFLQEDNSIPLVALVRIYGAGSDLFIDRTQEVQNMQTLAAAGLGPPLYARFTNGLVYGYTEGEVLTLEGMSTHYQSVAHTMAKWHALPPANTESPFPQPQLFPAMYKYLYCIKVQAESGKNKEAASTLLAQHDQLVPILEDLEQWVLHHVSSPIVFCHNDLLSGNLVYNEKDDRISFIDYEYGCWSYRAFDLANHFCEWAGFECEWHRMPSPSQQRAWIREYLHCLSRTTSSNSHSKSSETATKPTGNQVEREEIQEEEVDVLLEQVGVFILLAHIYWGLWALVQASVSSLDFDYMAYGEERLLQGKLGYAAWVTGEGRKEE